MSRIAEMIVVSGGPIKDGPGIHGANIGNSWAFPGLILEIKLDDPESPHDGWVEIVGPRPDPVSVDGTWKATDKVGWFELTHLAAVGAEDMEYRLVLKKDGTVKSMTRIR